MIYFVYYGTAITVAYKIKNAHKAIYYRQFLFLAVFRFYE